MCSTFTDIDCYIHLIHQIPLMFVRKVNKRDYSNKSIRESLCISIDSPKVELSNKSLEATTEVNIVFPSGNRSALCVENVIVSPWQPFIC